MSEVKKGEIVYSSQRSGFEPGRIYRNPRYFTEPLIDGVSRVIIIGDWPKVFEAYRAAGGVEIEVLASTNALTRLTPAGNVPSDELKAKIEAATGVQSKGGHEQQGAGHDPHAVGHELVGRAAAPEKVPQDDPHYGEGANNPAAQDGAAEIAAAAERAPTDPVQASQDAPADPVPAPAAGGGETEETRRAVEIPANWRDLGWQPLRALAAKVSPKPVINSEDCIKAIEVELQIREEIKDKAAQ